MRIGEKVRTAVALPGIPEGATGIIAETGRLFVLVAFEDGRTGYYTHRQLRLPQRSNDAQAAPSVALGIGGLRVARGAHCCVLPSTQTAALTATAGFAAAGLRGGEAVIGAIPTGWRRTFISRLQRTMAGQLDRCRERLVIVAPRSIYLPMRQFTCARQLRHTADALKSLAAPDSMGIRAFAHTGRRPALSGWWEYEKRATPLLQRAGVTALCVYDSTGWGSEWWHKATEMHAYVIRDGVVAKGGVG